ncbi:MAG: NTP transferase domain-containing protein, partial [Pseudomonadota bacterium]
MRDLGRHAPLVAGVILAGGLSRRMGGGDKSLKQLAGRPMLDHVIARLRPQLGVMALNANGDPARFSEFGLPVVADVAEVWVFAHVMPASTPARGPAKSSVT